MPARMKWQDWASFGLAVWLAISPWLLGFSAHEAATANAVLVGLFLIAISLFELWFPEMAQEWLNLAAGIWLLAAPPVLGFAGYAAPALDAVVVGVLVAGLAAWAMSLDKAIGKWWHDHVTGH
jgi:hypothetical protein